MAIEFIDMVCLSKGFDIPFCVSIAENHIYLPLALIPVSTHDVDNGFVTIGAGMVDLQISGIDYEPGRDHTLEIEPWALHPFVEGGIEVPEIATAQILPVLIDGIAVISCGSMTPAIGKVVTEPGHVPSFTPFLIHDALNRRRG